MDSLSVAPTCPSCYLTFFHIPERSIALVKRLAGSPKGAEIDPNLPHAKKCYSKVAHAFLYTWMDFFQSHQTVPSCCYLTLPYPERSIALKRLAGSPKGAEIDPNLPHANKSVTSKVAHAFLYTWMDLFQSHQTVPKPLLSYLLPYSRTFNCTSKTTGWFTKRS
jgi:hypothetical protein